MYREESEAAPQPESEIETESERAEKSFKTSIRAFFQMVLRRNGERHGHKCVSVGLAIGMVALLAMKAPQSSVRLGRISAKGKNFQIGEALRAEVSRFHSHSRRRSSLGLKISAQGTSSPRSSTNPAAPPKAPMWVRYKGIFTEYL